MFTQCPHCDTVYPLPPRLLAEGRGRILCGACEQEFDALARLREYNDYAQYTAIDHPAELPRLEAEPALEQGSLFPMPPVARATAMAADPIPAFAAPHVSRPHHTLLWSGLALLLSGLLILQILLAQRFELAADSRWRPMLEPLCRHLRCDLPAWDDPRGLQMLARDISPHPSMPDALMVTATLRNPGPWRQAWPQLELSLANLDGRTLALRRFSPEEYLGAAPEIDALAPGESVIARLELQDPGKSAVAFSFDFR